MNLDLPFMAGAISTIMFCLGTLPMVRKAIVTRDLHSYSGSTIVLSNVGNGVHAIYIFSLPPGPIWLLHTFHMVTTGIMLVWYLRFEWQPSLGPWLAGRPWSESPLRRRLARAHRPPLTIS